MSARIPATTLLSLALAGLASAAPPADNPVATFYDGDTGYPAWTDRIRWSNVVDMAAYAKGGTAFEKFENARDEVAAKGGGVLYYPAGTYDFSEGPFDGPGGRGLMLRAGVVIRGEAPPGKPVAAKDGALPLRTRFDFGFRDRADAVDAGDRLTLVLEGADVRTYKRKGAVRHEPKPLILSFAVADGKIQSGVKAFRRGLGRDVWPGTAKIEEKDGAIKLSVALEVTGKEGAGKAACEIALTRKGDSVSGTYTGTCREHGTKGSVAGRFLRITPKTPREWNLVGLMPEAGKGVKDVHTVGIAWVHLTGATIYFGPDVAWGETWGTAGSWKSAYVRGPWKDRKPDGTHPWDPLAGGGKTYAGAGDGRLVFGCVLEHAAVHNEAVRMGRPDLPEGFGEGGYYLYKFGPRIGAYGSRVFVANNLLPESRGHNFKYGQTTRRTWPKGGSGMGFDPPRRSVVFYDYNKSAGVDINKTLLGLTKNSPTGKAGTGYFSEGVVVVDNHVYNNGHKGFNVSGDGVTIARNRNAREMLVEGWDPERIGGWELTLDGHLESSPGGNGAISDNLARAFDLAGKNLWVHRNTYDNLGSDPGNDGEGILCQAHGGSQIFAWAVTYNRHEKGRGETGYIGGWDVNVAGALFGWNEIPGWIGSINVGKRESSDAAFVGNRAGAGLKPMKGALAEDPGGTLAPPVAVKAAPRGDDAVTVAWEDASDNEVGFRVDRRIGGGAWTAIAYRPPRIQGHEQNPQMWIDYLAPRGKPLAYRVVALNAKDDLSGWDGKTVAGCELPPLK
jgi:hypothetical protein